MKTEALNKFDGIGYFMALRDSKIWDYLAWFGLFYILMWTILKISKVL